MSDTHPAFRCALDDYRPGSEADTRQQKIERTMKELGIVRFPNDKKDYLALCELAAVCSMW